MKPTKHHLALWNRLHTPEWAKKIEQTPPKTWWAKEKEIRQENEIHSIINARVGLIKKNWYKIDNAMSLYQLARRNAIRSTGTFVLSEYIKTMWGGGSDEHLRHFKRWERKINKFKNRA